MDKKKILWSVLSVLIAGCSIWAVCTQTKDFSFTDFRAFLMSADKGWMLLSGCCAFGFIWFEGFAVIRIADVIGYRRNLRQGTVYGAADVYFSAITPSASGGQPASAFFMIRDKMPVTAVTVTLLLNLIMYNLALFTLGMFCILLRFDLFQSFSLISRLFIGVGSLVLMGMALVFYLFLRRAGLLLKLCCLIMKILEKWHLLHHVEEKKKKLIHTLEEYQHCSDIITDHKKMIAEVFLLNVCQRVAQFGVSFMIFMASGYGVREAARAWLVQCYVSMGSNCVPIPGSMGVADYLMLDGFAASLGRESAAYMELLCRGISFYGCIVLSLLIVVIAFLAGRKKGNTAGG